MANRKGFKFKALTGLDELLPKMADDLLDGGTPEEIAGRLAQDADDAFTYTTADGGQSIATRAAEMIDGPAMEAIALFGVKGAQAGAERMHSRIMAKAAELGIPVDLLDQITAAVGMGD